MSQYTKIRQQIRDKMRPKLPPKKPPPADIKEQMQRVKDEIERRKKE